MKNIIKKNGKHYLVSTVDTFDNGWETMVFLCDADGEVADWAELACNRYSDREEADTGHFEMVQNFHP